MDWRAADPLAYRAPYPLGVGRIRVIGGALLLVLVGGACDGSRGESDATITTVVTTHGTIVVSLSCEQAVSAYHNALVETHNDPPLDVELSSQHQTINACTRAEWLEAVKPYTDTGAVGDIVVGNTTPTKVLRTLCSRPYEKESGGRLQGPVMACE